MSDSDETDVLLLIPPNFFLVSSNENSDTVPDTGLGSFSTTLQTTVKEFDYQMTERNIPIEIENNFNINKQNIDAEGNLLFKTPNKFVQPCYTLSSMESERSPGFLREIDHFITDKQPIISGENLIDNIKNSSVNVHPLTKQSIEKHNDLMAQHRSFSFDYGRNESFKNEENQDTFLISLNDIWCKNGMGNDQSTLQEERLRRMHCEKSIQVLQSRLLEYQQKISVAIEVDKAKDIAIKKNHDENQRLSCEISKLKSENSIFQTKLQNQIILENNLKNEQEIVSQLKENYEILESKCETLTRSSNEIKEIHKTQICDLEVRLSNSSENEKILNNEIKELKNQYEIIQNDLKKEKNFNSTTKSEIQKLNDEIQVLKQQKNSLLDKCREERIKSGKIEKEILSMKENLEIYKTKEKNLQRDLETQKISLKTFYQNQLEDVVQLKLTEFQQQLESVENSIKFEAKQRERTIAERAIKQMDLINQKSEQEISLLNEKHSEEISLYRIQLANASKTIDALQEKLQIYQTRRVDIAERLHSIMETQWHKALEILSSPNFIQSDENNKFQLKTNSLNQENLNDIILSRRNIESELFDTPINSNRQNKNFIKTQKSTIAKEIKNKNVEIYSDKLNDYIEMLLQKSPRDLEKINEILVMDKKSSKKSEHTITSQKIKPWK